MPEIYSAHQCQESSPVSCPFQIFLQQILIHLPRVAMGVSRMTATQVPVKQRKWIITVMIIRTQ